ncbi:M16 family metallopeptidase [Fulvivirga lutimaris]|uniref:M16 family metallopeptidase n=1 Tax=Fulvivirga lutimaris TaxID=1819566 RepID=UPI0012BD0544|nr:pitrilysin family protein [Fulvivirga lutimaris]MTI41784.1 insulinase family protein [Fulvivirga lutimaris]
MIEFQEFTLDNGLHVVVHEDPTVQIAVLNILYKVGSRDEDPNRTGFAHLFEHLMFGGSINVENFDEALQAVGGENNAFTSPDITNYYMTLPYQNIEAAFWLESDRMLGLPFSTNVLEVQRSVVIEEFKQRYLNQPYGDLWLKLRPLAYDKHSYQWATIGKEIGHIEDATMEDVKAFYKKYYNPNNAILVLSGNVKVDEVKSLAEKWFGPIPAGESFERKIPVEPKQKKKKFEVIEADVPSDMLYMAFHMPAKFEDDYNTCDLMSDILGREKSSRLYVELVREQKLFSSINAYVTGSLDPGLLIISGKMSDGCSLEDGEKAVWKVIKEFINKGTEEAELNKVKNQAESTHVFSEIEVLNRAMNLAFSALSGDTSNINKESEKIQSVTVEGIHKLSKEILDEKNCSVIHYKSKMQHEN